MMMMMMMMVMTLFNQGTQFAKEALCRKLNYKLNTKN